MNEKDLIEKKGSSMEDMPEQVDVQAVRQFSLDELEQRTQRLLRVAGEACKLSLGRGDWVRKENRTLVRLPRGARMVIYHASGAMRLVTGLSPMEALFEGIDSRKQLVKLVEDMGERLSIREWVGQNDKLAFEHLWQIKAAAADPQGNMIEPVLCRVVGAYRHYANGLPVWGPASVAIKLAGEGQLDSLTMHVRESTGEVIDQAKIIHPEQAARQIVTQVSGLMSRSNLQDIKGMKPSYFEFGYVSLPKRKAQRVLAPVYVAGIKIAAKEAQAYQVIVPASERQFMALSRNGSEAIPPTRQRA